MKDFEYALRSITLPDGRSLDIAHAVDPGTIVTACRALAEPVPGSHFADTDPGARCQPCEERLKLLAAAVVAAPPEPVRAPEPEPEREPTTLPEVEPAPVPEPKPQSERPPPVATKATGPALAERAQGGGTDTANRVSTAWERLGARGQIAVLGGLLVLIVMAFVIFNDGGEFTPDQNSPAYENGYAYGHDLMSTTDFPANRCRDAVAGLGDTDERTWIAGCEAGYADAHH